MTPFGFVPGKSIFNAGEDIVGLIRNAVSQAPVKQAVGRNFERIVDAGRIIGIDRTTGRATSIYTVITDAAGNLVTAFPGNRPEGVRLMNMIFGQTDPKGSG